MTDYHPVKGDRVRVTRVFEGIVGEVGCTGIRLDHDQAQTRFDFQSPFWATRGMVTQSFEKLADPEPVWVNGDVIHIGPFLKGYRLGGKWLNEDGEVHYWSRGGEALVPKAWREGTLTVLYKADS